MTELQETIRSRLAETFEGETQETTAANLNTSQGNVSKWKTGQQMPTTDMLIAIAKTYNVSIDWLLGLSNCKEITQCKTYDEITYDAAVQVVTDILYHGSKISNPGKDVIDPVQIEICDPILNKLLRKGFNLLSLDREYYDTWKRERLNVFSNKSLLFKSTFHNDGLLYAVYRSNTEQELLHVYASAKAEENRKAESAVK